MRQRRKERYKTARGVLVRNGRVLLAVHSSFWGKRQQRWGLPGGSIEWRESPAEALARELREELDLYLPEEELFDIGAFHYKRAMHRVFAAAVEHEITDYDDSELLDLGWFDYAEVERMSARSELHAGYELEALLRAMRALA